MFVNGSKWNEENVFFLENDQPERRIAYVGHVR
jgi:hypothetical protein